MSLTDEQKMIQETASDITKQELAPRATDIDRQQRFPRGRTAKACGGRFHGIDCS